MIHDPNTMFANTEHLALPSGFFNSAVDSNNFQQQYWKCALYCSYSNVCELDSSDGNDTEIIFQSHQ